MVGRKGHEGTGALPGCDKRGQHSTTCRFPPAYLLSKFLLLILQVFPPLPCRGKLSTKLQAIPTEDVQSECFYPSCDLATPPYTPALEGEILSRRQLPSFLLYYMHVTNSASL